MDKKLVSALLNIDEIDFRVLQHHMTIAGLFRDTVSRHGLTDAQLGQRIGITKRQVKAFRNGAYPYSLKDLASLESYLQEKAAEDAKLKIQVVSFPKYKYSEPPAPVDHAEKSQSKK